MGTDYGPLKIPLFRCQWVNLAQGGVTTDKYGMTIVDLNKIGYKNEPFVLAKDVTQVFFVKDMSSFPKRRANIEPKRHMFSQEKDQLLELRTFRTNQKILTSLTTCLHSQWMLTLAFCCP